MDVEERLIEVVRSFPILYNLSLPDYKNVKKKEYTWREVAACMELNVEDCKKRWRGLRDSYKRCKRLQQIASGSGADVTKKKWRYFDAMSFLDDITSSRSTVGNINIEDIIEVIDTGDDDSYLSATMQSSSSTRDKKKSDSEKFQEFLDLAASSITETCAAKQEQDPTALLFASLAAKIKSASMPASEVNSIEAKVSSLVFKEIESFYAKSRGS